MKGTRPSVPRTVRKNRWSIPCKTAISPDLETASNSLAGNPRLHSLKLGESEFGQEPAFVARDRGDAERDFDGLLSPAALGITRITFDLQRGLLAFGR